MHRLISALAVLILAIMTIAAPRQGYSNPVAPRAGTAQTEREVQELEKAIQALQNSISERTTRLASIEAELLSTQNRLRAANQELRQIERRLQTISNSFAARVRSAYMHGMSSYLETILNSDSFGELITRMAYLRRIFTRDASLIATVRKEQASARKTADTLAAEETRLRRLREQREAEGRNLRNQRQEQERLLRAAQTRLAVDLALITPQVERRPVYAVVIDNIAQARPQSGLAEANVIYEYEVEGRITRYLALFANLPQKVGPIRSARSHSAMLALEHNSHFVYSSGGVDVLDLLRDWNVEGTNALRSNSASFTRDASRRAPHNLFVNLATLGQAKQSSEVVVRPAYVDARGSDALEFSIQYAANHIVSYTYARDRGAYRRQINGQVHRDANGTVIMARNIIIQYAPHGTDLLGRPTPNLVGEGTIDYYALGQHFRGTWKKSSPTEPTKFYFEDGREIERIYGQTWVQIVRRQ